MGTINDSKKTKAQLLKEMREMRKQIDKFKASEDSLNHAYEKEDMQQQEQLLAMFDGMEEVVYVADPKTYDMLYMNRIAKEIWGDYKGKKCYEVLQNLKSPCPFCTNDKIFRKNLGKTHVWEFQNKTNQSWYRCIDRAIRWTNGKMVRFELAIDLSDRKKAEEALQESEDNYRALIESSPDIIAMADISGKILNANRRGVELQGYASKEEMLGLTFFDMVDPKDHERVANEIARLLEVGRIDSLVFTMLRKNGTTYMGEISASMILNPDKSPKMLIVTVRDVTERKKAEKKLQESEVRLSLALSGANQGTWDWNIKTGEVFFSERWTGMLGYEVGELAPNVSAWESLMHPEDKDRVMQDLNRHFENDAFKYETEFRLKTRSGEWKWVDARGQVFARDEDNKPLRMVGTHIDITERKKAEKKLQESEVLLSETGKMAKVGGWGVDAQTLDVSWTEEVYRLHEVPLGHKPPLEEAINFFHPDDSPKLETAIQKALEYGEPYDMELRFITAKGKHLWSHTICKPIRVGGKIVKLTGTFQDITESKKVQDELEKRTHDLGERVKELNCLYKIYQFAAESRKSMDEILRNIVDVIPPAWQYPDITCARIIFQEQEFKTKNFINTEWKQSADIVVLGKKEGILEVCYLKEMPKIDEGPFLNEERSLINALARKIRFIYQQDRLEEQLRQTQKMESIGQLAGGVAHDFNNILMPIMGYAEMAMSDLNPKEKLYEDLKIILEAGQGAAALTSQLLSFGRKQTLKMSLTNLNSKMEEFSKMLKRIIGEDIELTTYLQPDLGSVKVDMNQIQQILMNLASNARDAMPDGGELIIETADVILDREYASTHPNIVPGSYVMFAVSDNGCGMSEDTKTHVFEPYFTTKVKGKGTGLGLSTVYGIVKQHGGYIWVYSEPGKGTAFKVYLPRVNEAVSRCVEPSKDMEKSGGGETILVVEDDEKVKNMTCRMLSSLNYKVLSSLSPTEALTIIDQYKDDIDLLLTDVVMPKMNGKQLYEKIVSSKPDLKVLYMSGYTENTIAHHGVLEKKTEFLQKPFSKMDLAQTLRRIFGKKI